MGLSVSLLARVRGSCRQSRHRPEIPPAKRRFS